MKGSTGRRPRPAARAGTPVASRRPRLGARRAARVARYAVAVGRSYARVRAPTPPARAASTVPAVPARAHGTRCALHAARAAPRGAGVLGECGDRRVSGKPQTRIGSLVESHYDTAYRYRRAARVSRPDHVAGTNPRVTNRHAVTGQSRLARARCRPPVASPDRGHAPPPTARGDGPTARTSRRREADSMPAEVAAWVAATGKPWQHAATGRPQGNRGNKPPPERLDALRRSTGSLSPPTADPRPPPPRTVYKILGARGLASMIIALAIWYDRATDRGLRS